MSEVVKEESELMTLIDENNYEHEGNMYLFEYDPPFTPSWMRNNEVLLKVHKRSEIWLITIIIIWKLLFMIYENKKYLR